MANKLQKKTEKEIKDYHWEIEKLEREIKIFKNTIFYKIWEIASKLKWRLIKN